MSGAGVGSLFGTFILASLGNFRRKNRLLLGCIFPLRRLPVLPRLVPLVLAVLGHSVLHWHGQHRPNGHHRPPTLRPRRTPGPGNEHLVRFGGFMFIGSFPMTVVADTLGWTAAFAGGAAIYLLIAFILGVLRPTLRRLDV